MPTKPVYRPKQKHCSQANGMEGSSPTTTTQTPAPNIAWESVTQERRNESAAHDSRSRSSSPNADDHTSSQHANGKSYYRDKHNGYNGSIAATEEYILDDEGDELHHHIHDESSGN